MRDQKLHIVLIHTLGQQEKCRLDFETEIPVTEIFEQLKLDGYKIYQVILDDNQYIMPQSDLVRQEISFDRLERVKKTWFGLGRKIVTDILIYPKSDFYYPYEFGNYTYLFSQHDYSKEQIDSWLNNQFPNRWADLDETYAGFNTESVELINPQDYLLITNHDYQTEFGIIGNQTITDKILDIFRQMDLSKFEEEIYKHK